jgi:hypothetical protein
MGKLIAFFLVKVKSLKTTNNNQQQPTTIMSSFAQINALIAAAERRQEQDANTIGELHVELLWARADIDGLQREVKMLREIISVQQQAAVAAASAPDSEDAKREKKNEAMRERNRSMVKDCLCGGKTTCDKVRRERHEASQMHQAWVARNEQYSDASEE